MLRFGWVVIGVGLWAAAATAEDIDPQSDGSQFAYAENVGWLNAEPLGDEGPGVKVSDFSLGGWIWGENVGWINLSCENNATCAAVAYGVVNDGHGALSGYAWGENIGWVNFAPGFAGVSINVLTGDFIGRAWGENTGWITFSSTGPVSYRVRTSWCNAVTSEPSGSPLMTLARSGSDAILSWDALPGASWYEVVRGDLATLRASGGNFAASTAACASDNLTATSFTFSDNPTAGTGFWFLVRGANCKGKGTYDSESAAQVGLRDAEVAASNNDCK